jgi:SARP family transcriptional regulator, regulator of embCAB operon
MEHFMSSQPENTGLSLDRRSGGTCTNTTEIGILGTLRSKIEGSEVVLPGTKLRSILAILAYRTGETVASDVLVEELGLDRTSTNAANALQAHVSRLRRWLCTHNSAPDLLETTNSGYRLNLARPQVDAHLFVDQAEQALALAPAAPSVVATMLEDALKLWRGDAFLDVIDGPLVAAIADELKFLRATAREVLLEAWLALGNDHQVVVKARAYVGDDPLNERLWESQIIALRRLGRHAQAVDCFNRARKTLRDELGIQPGDGMRAAVGHEIPAPTRNGAFGERSAPMPSRIDARIA